MCWQEVDEAKNEDILPMMRIVLFEHSKSGQCIPSLAPWSHNQMHFSTHTDLFCQTWYKNLQHPLNMLGCFIWQSQWVPEKSMFVGLAIWSLGWYKQPTKDHPLSILKSLKWANWEEEQFWRMFGSSDQWWRWNSSSGARALQLYKHHQQTYCCLLCCVPSQSVPFKGCFRYEIFCLFD